MEQIRRKAISQSPLYMPTKPTGIRYTQNYKAILHKALSQSLLHMPTNSMGILYTQNYKVILHKALSQSPLYICPRTPWAYANVPTNPMGILYEQNYNAQAEYAREDFIPENIPTVQHVQIDSGLKQRSLTYRSSAYKLPHFKDIRKNWFNNEISRIKEEEPQFEQAFRDSIQLSNRIVLTSKLPDINIHDVMKLRIPKRWSRPHEKVEVSHIG